MAGHKIADPLSPFLYVIYGRPQKSRFKQNIYPLLLCSWIKSISNIKQKNKKFIL